MKRYQPRKPKVPMAMNDVEIVRQPAEKPASDKPRLVERVTYHPRKGWVTTYEEETK